MTAAQKYRWGAWAVWMVLLTVVLGDVARRPLQHTTMLVYRIASTRWWQGVDPYTRDAHAGFLYLPQAAVLFTPFNVVPFGLGEILWRLVTFGLFYYALVRLSQFFLSRDGSFSEKTFFLLTLLAIWSSLASLRNAQFDLPLAALLVLTAAEVAAQRWNAAAFWLCFALALKPLAMVPLLLFGALYWRLIPRLAVGLILVVALPFLHWNPAFVAHEYARCVDTLAWASKGDEPRYSDLAALFSKLGWDVPYEARTIARLCFAPIFLGLGFLATRRLRAAEAAWIVGALSADYLMLFNPRTETCSYVFLGPFVASAALFYAREPGRRALAFALGFAAIGLASDAFPKLVNFSIHDLTDRWFKPLIALLFFPVLLEFILRKQPQAGSPASSR